MSRRCVGWGDRKQADGAKSRGLHLHSTLTVTDEGLPLGVLSARCDAPHSLDEEDKRAPAKVPIEEKKTWCWVLAMRDCEAVAADMPHTQVVQVMDREADFFELFDEWRSGSRRTELLIRAKHNRRTTADAKLFDGVKATEPRLQFRFQFQPQVPAPSSSPKSIARASGRSGASRRPAPGVPHEAQR